MKEQIIPCPDCPIKPKTFEALKKSGGVNSKLFAFIQSCKGFTCRYDTCIVLDSSDIRDDDEYAEYFDFDIDIDDSSIGWDSQGLW